MKTLAIVLAFVTASFSSTSLFSQIKKGDVAVGGSFDFSRNGLEDNYSKTMSFNFAPTVLRLVTDRFALGASIPFSYYGTLNDGPKNSYLSFSAGPIARYYFPVGKKTYFFPEVKYSYGAARTKSYFFDTGGLMEFEYTTNTQTFSAGAGISYFLIPNVALEGIIGYDNLRSKNQDTDTKFSSASIGVNFGFQIYLNRRAE